MSGQSENKTCICTNCSASFNDASTPAFFGELSLPKNKKIKVYICPACMKKPYIQKDRILEKAFKQLGQDIALCEGA